MKTGPLSTVIALGAFLAGCGGAAVCPETTAPHGALAGNSLPSGGGSKADSASPPQLEGTFRAVEIREGSKVTRLSDALLAQAPSCYSVRMLWTFHQRSLGMTMEMLCDTDDVVRSVDLCRASLEVDIRWGADGFEIPVAVRASGNVDRIGLTFEKIPGGMKRSTANISRGCNVALKAASIGIKQKGDSLVLSTADGDMVFVPEPDAAGLDWHRESLRLYEERHGAK